MAEADFVHKNVEFLKSFLRDRGVSVSKSKKQELIELCKQADSLRLELDPDGLFDCRSTTISEKLRVNGVALPLPTLLDSTNNLSILPVLKTFDILHFLSKGIGIAAVRNHKNLEGYQLFRDKYVLELNCTQLDSTFSALVSKVKPRTNAKDPLTGLPYYISWVILSSSDSEERILSAFCCCRGGIDGFCRHVAATLFEYNNFRDEEAADQTSCTSLPCVWNRPGNCTEPTNPVEVRHINTCINDNNATATTGQPDTRPMLTDMTKMTKDAFFATMQTMLPDACVLDKHFIRKTNIVVPVLNVPTPVEKLKIFKDMHTCVNKSCKCSAEFLNTLCYTKSEQHHIDHVTMGQSSNQNWHDMRKHILTASCFKTICHSSNRDNTAIQMLKDKATDFTYTPAPIQYGKRNEDKARTLFFRSHQIKHTCKLQEKGLVFSDEVPYLACSPDGVILCDQCGPFLIEIKCLWKYRNFHPRVAGLMSGLLKEVNDLCNLDQKHAYYYQVQGQMAVTGIKKAVLVLFTDKGIFPVNVPFNKSFCKEMYATLDSFYHDYFFAKIFC